MRRLDRRPHRLARFFFILVVILDPYITSLCVCPHTQTHTSNLFISILHTPPHTPTNPPSFPPLVGVTLHIKSGPAVWRIPFAIQLIPAGIMCLGLFTTRESPRFLASIDAHSSALTNLAYLRRLPPTDPALTKEFAEILAVVQEERESRKGVGLREAVLGKGNWPRFGIAFVIFLFQQWCGQNSVGYYAPQIFQSVSGVGFQLSRTLCFRLLVYYTCTNSTFVFGFVS